MDYLLVLLSGFVEFTILPLVACYQNILLNSLQLIGDFFYVTNRMWRVTLTFKPFYSSPPSLCQHKQRHKKNHLKTNHGTFQVFIWYIYYYQCIFLSYLSRSSSTLQRRTKQIFTKLYFANAGREEQLSEQDIKWVW